MKRLIRVGLRTLALAAACGLATPALALNLLANPGFEAAGGGYSGWFTFGSGVQLSTTATDNILHNGVAAAKIFGGFNNCPIAPTFNVGGFGQAFTAPSAGHTYEFSGFAYMASSDSIPGTNTCTKNRVLAKIAFFNAAAGGAEIGSNEIVIGDGSTLKDAWHGFTVSAPTPPGAQRVEALILYLQPGCDPGSVFVDDVSFGSYPTPAEPNTLTNPSFSSALTGWTTFGNVFPDTRSFARRTASGSAKLFSTFVTGAPSGLFQSKPTTPGTAWEFKVNALTTCQESPINETNDNFLLARIVFKDGGGVELGGGDALVLDANTPIGTWTPSSVQAVAPTGTVTVESYVLFISPTNQNGAAWIDDLVLRTVPTAGVTPNALSLALSAPAPNPFRGTTRIGFTLPAAGELSIRVFDVAGRGVATLLEGMRTAGTGSVQWDGRRSDGSLAAPGIYQVVLRSNGQSVTRRMVLAN